METDNSPSIAPETPTVEQGQNKNSRSNIIIVILLILFLFSFTAALYLYLEQEECPKNIECIADQEKDDVGQIEEDDENEIYAEDTEEYYSYCLPTEDPDFVKVSEDEDFYYYEGDKVIRGVIMQTGLESDITFDTHVGQSCKFVPTKGYLVSEIDLLNMFDIADAWEEDIECDSSTTVEGSYSLRVKGFKIPKEYIDEYEPNVYRDGVYMSGFTNYIDYEEIDEVHEKSHQICNVVLY